MTLTIRTFVGKMMSLLFNMWSTRDGNGKLLQQSLPLEPHEPQHARPPCPSPFPEITQIHVHRVSDAIQPSILCRPLLLLPSIFPGIGVFSNESALCTSWPMYWSFGFSISPSNEYSGLISFGIDWFDLLAVQRTLKNLLQHHRLKASILCYISEKNQRIGLNKHVPGLKKEKSCNSVVPRD